MRSTAAALGILASAFLVGCQKPAPTTPAPQIVVSGKVKGPEPKPLKVLPAIDRSTPESALKSFWAIKDAIASLRRPCEDCLRLRDREKEIVTGDMLEGYKFQVDVPMVLDRQIKESTRSKNAGNVVEIVAVIRNVTPFPPEAAPNDYIRKKRENGDRYRYALTETAEGWKISEISFWYEPSGSWMKITSAKPFVPFQTAP